MRKLNAKMEEQAHSSCSLSLKLGNFKYCPFTQLEKKMGSTQSPSASPQRLCSRNKRQYLQLWRDRQTTSSCGGQRLQESPDDPPAPPRAGGSFPPVCSQTDLFPTAPSTPRNPPRDKSSPPVTPIPSPGFLLLPRSPPPSGGSTALPFPRQPSASSLLSKPNRALSTHARDANRNNNKTRAANPTNNKMQPHNLPPKSVRRCRRRHRRRLLLLLQTLPFSSRLSSAEARALGGGREGRHRHRAWGRSAPALRASPALTGAPAPRKGGRGARTKRPFRRRGGSERAGGPGRACGSR